MLLVALFLSGMAFLVCLVMWLKHRSTAGALSNTARFTVRELGGIPLDGTVEVFGQTRIHEAPVAGPVSGTQGVWWRVKVTEHWRERRDDKWEEMSRVLSDTHSPELFFLEDPTGFVAVLPAGVAFTELQHSFYSREDRGIVVRLGLSLGFSGSTDHWVETEEWVMPYDVSALVLAHAGQDQNGTRFLYRGGGQRSPFLARTDDPEAFEAKTVSKSKLWMWGAAGSLALALALLAVHLSA